MQISELPEDNSLWLVKWIDEFRLPHLRTRSPSVSLLLQRLPAQDPHTLHKLTPTEVAELFAKSVAPQDWLKIPLLVGYMPYVTKGMVFQNKQYVGQLPARFDNIHLHNVDETCRHIELQDLVEPPPNWDIKYPYRAINPSQYFGLLPNGFHKSQCIIHQVGDTQFIIPRSVIFRSFYGQTAKMANAFCKGPWLNTSHDLVYFGQMESGLETKNNADESSWDIVLQPKVKIEYAPILAAFLFDPFAQQSAESIYARALQERGNRPQAEWHANANFPFDTSIAALDLRIKGYSLKRSWSKSPEKILVTAIVASSFPAYFPTVRWEKFNSGARGEEVQEVNEPAPYQTSAPTEPAPANATAVSNVDIDAGALSVLAEDFSWINPPSVEKIPKERSKKYQKSNNNQQVKNSTDELSAGTTTYQQGGLTEAQVETLVRYPGKRFEHLIDAFDDLIQDGVISNYAIIGPTDRSMLATRGGLPCWNFLDEVARKTGIWPRRGWRLAELPGSENPKGCGLPRCALVIAVEIGSTLGYWIEIEARPHSSEGFRSPFIVTQEDPHDMIAHFIELIAENNGVNLAKQLPVEAQKLTTTFVKCYKHYYKSENDPSLDTKSIRKFFEVITSEQ